MKRLAWFAGVLLLCGGQVLACMPQPSRIHGKVTDAVSGAALCQQVSLSSGGWSQSSTTSDGNGDYHFGGLTPGDYVVSVQSMPPYLPHDPAHVHLGPGDDAEANFALDRMQPNVAVDVIKPTGERLGGGVEIRYRIKAR